MALTLSLLVGCLFSSIGLRGATSTFTAAPPRQSLPVAQRGILVVGAANDSFPYGYVDEKGQPTGFTVDLLDAVARIMNLQIRRELMPGREIQARFRAGEFDLLQALSQTTDRDNYADFSTPFLTLQGAIFVQKNRSPIRQLADFSGRRFAVVGIDSIGQQFFAKHGIQVEAVNVSSTTEGLALVESGACVGVYASQLTALSVIKRRGYANVIQFGAPVPDHDIRHCFPVHKGDAQLLARLNEGLALIRANGEFARIYERWFGHIGSPLISRERVVTSAALIFAVAFAFALWGLLHQLKLRRRLATQAAELARQKALLQALYDNIPMAMCVLQSEPAGLRIISINRQAEIYVGLSPDRAAGALLSSIPLDSEWAAVLQELLQHGLGSSAYLREERRLPKAQKRLILTLVPMAAETAGHTRVCVLVEDITERRNLDEEIAQSRKLRAVGELVGGIAHEFNNLLTPIMLRVGEIQAGWHHDAALIAETRIISEAVQRSAELTRRLLTFGRKNEVRVESVHLRQVVDTCFGLMRLTMDRRIVWEQAVPDDLPPLTFNTTDLNQIILNLIINARDTLIEKLAHRRDHWTPVIRVEARSLASDSSPADHHAPSRRQILGWQCLTVRDNGLGMSADVRERIFEPFFTTKAVGKGTGLGLATVWHLVTEISGRIEVESTPGEGTAFHVYLPILPCPAAPDAPAVVPPPAASLLRIFLADDDELVAKTVSAALRRAGHTVFHLANGADAWVHLQTQFAAYDLLILDVNMPGLDGIELAQRIREAGHYRGRIMIISGRLGSDDLEQISAAGVDCVLNKPFSGAELLGAIRPQASPVRAPGVV